MGSYRTSASGWPWWHDATARPEALGRRDDAIRHRRRHAAVKGSRAPLNMNIV